MQIRPFDTVELHPRQMALPGGMMASSQDVDDEFTRAPEGSIPEPAIQTGQSQEYEKRVRKPLRGDLKKCFEKCKRHEFLRGLVSEIYDDDKDEDDESVGFSDLEEDCG